MTTTIPRPRRELFHGHHAQLQLAECSRRALRVSARISLLSLIIQAQAQALTDTTSTSRSTTGFPTGLFLEAGRPISVLTPKFEWRISVEHSVPSAPPRPTTQATPLDGIRLHCRLVLDKMESLLLTLQISVFKISRLGDCLRAHPANSRELR